MRQERAGAVTMRGKPVTLIGPEIKAGDPAPDFTVVGRDLAPFDGRSLNGKVRILSVVPSVDTPVCDAQTRRFDEEAAKLAGVEVVTVSMDLPFALNRWCGAAGIDHVRLFSDHRDGSFGTSWGTLIKGLRLLGRAVFVVDRDDRVVHAEYVKEITAHPDYDAVLRAAREAAA